MITAENVKAVILVGGLGTRLQPLTNDVPKPVVPLLNRPFIEYTFAYLKQFGVHDIILSMSYLPESIRERFGDGSGCGVCLTYCLEEEPLGTAGAVKNAEQYLDGSFFVFNGDVFTDLDLAAMFKQHRKRGAKATISLNWVEDPSAFGVVETDDDGRVSHFIEKPPREEATTNWINAGTYVLEPEVLDLIPPGTHYMFERGLFPDLLQRGGPVYGFPHRGYWLDMGTPQKYFSLNMDLLTAITSSPLLSLNGKESRYGNNVTIDPSSEIVAPVIIGDGCIVGSGAHVSGPSVIGRDCRIESDGRVENSIIWDNVIVGPGVSVSRSIISCGVRIGAGEKISNLVVTPSQTAPLSR